MTEDCATVKGATGRIRHKTLVLLVDNKFSDLYILYLETTGAESDYYKVVESRHGNFLSVKVYLGE